MPKPIIDKNKCVNCGTCVDVCPMECFENTQGDVTVTLPDECIGCKACEVQCPHSAIIVED